MAIEQLEQPERRDHRRLGDIQQVDGHLMVSTLSSQVGRLMLDMQDWVAVQCRCVVESAVIAGTVCPGDSELGRVEAPGPGIDRWADGGRVVLHQPVLGSGRQEGRLREDLELGQESMRDSLLESAPLRVHRR